MIYYKKGGVNILLNTFKMSGSVFPQATGVALPCALCASAMRVLHEHGYWSPVSHEDSILSNNAIWSGFSFLVGFLVVFRTSQAYARFCDGCTSSYKMRAEWFDACCSLVAFCRFSDAGDAAIFDFQNVLIRLFSMLHAAALAEIEDNCCHASNSAKAFQFELIDVQGIDERTLETIKDCDCKVEMIFTWIQTLVVDNVKKGVLNVPAPILSRAFQEIANGMVAYHDATKISHIPLPFPYSQCCDFLLMLHWLMTPCVFAKWVVSPWWAAVFCFFQVFMLWALNFIAVEVENPFGLDQNDLDGRYLQEDMNKSLKALLRPQVRQVPTLNEGAMRYETLAGEIGVDDQLNSAISFHVAWEHMNQSRSLEENSLQNQVAHLFSAPTKSADGRRASTRRAPRDSAISSFSLSLPDRPARASKASDQQFRAARWEPIGSSTPSDLECGSPGCSSSDAPFGVRFAGHDREDTVPSSADGVGEDAAAACAEASADCVVREKSAQRCRRFPPTRAAPQVQSTLCRRLTEEESDAPALPSLPPDEVTVDFICV